jgi:hypothetical protein
MPILVFYKICPVCIYEKLIYFPVINDTCIIRTVCITFNESTAQQKKKKFLVPWILVLFVGLSGALIQKLMLDRPH